MVWPFQKPAAPPPPPEALSSLLPALAAVVLCWQIPLLLVLWRARPQFVKKLGVEVAGSFAFKLAVNATVIHAANRALEAEWTAALVQSVVWTLIVILAFPSGGHLNSAITVGFWSSGLMSMADTALFVGAQLTGCALAMETIRVAAPAALHGSIVPPPPATSILSAVLHEAAFTGANVLLGIGCGDFFGTRVEVKTASLVIVLIRVGGACMDPSGAFAGAFFARDFTHLLEVYWLGGVAGAILAGKTHRLLFAKEKTA